MGLMNRWLACVLLATSLPAQRSPFFATVTGPDGKPLANAAVTCVSSRDSMQPWPTDTVIASTDQRGQARCDLLPGRFYVAWAAASQKQDDKHWVTAVARLISGGRVVTLEAVESQPPRTIQLAGLSAWRDAGAQSLRWYPDRAVDHTVNLRMPAAETVTIPATPWTNGVLAVCDARGVMTCVHIPAGPNKRHTLRKPSKCTVTVVDNAGEPIENAQLSTQIEELGGSRMLMGGHRASLANLRPLGSTDAAGQLSFVTQELLTHVEPWGTRSDIIVLHASCDGMQQATGAAETLTPLTIRMMSGTPLEVRLKGSGAVDASFAGMGTYFAYPTPQSATFGPRLARTVKADSSWLVHGLGSSFQARIQLARKRPTFVLSKAISNPTSPHVIDLDARKTTTIAVTHEDTGPAACLLLVGRPKEQIPMRWEAILATDTSGHADLLVEDGNYFVYAISGTSHGLAMIDAGTRHADIEMTRLETMTVRCVDAEGFAIEGARSRGDSTTMSGRVKGADIESQWTRLSTMMVWHFLEPCRSGPDGRMHLPVFLKGNAKARAKLWIAGAESKPFQLVAGTELEVVIE